MAVRLCGPSRCSCWLPGPSNCLTLLQRHPNPTLTRRSIPATTEHLRFSPPSKTTYPLLPPAAPPLYQSPGGGAVEPSPSLTLDCPPLPRCHPDEASRYPQHPVPPFASPISSSPCSNSPAVATTPRHCSGYRPCCNYHQQGYQLAIPTGVTLR